MSKSDSKYKFTATASIIEVPTQTPLDMHMDEPFVIERLGITPDMYAKGVKKKDPKIDEVNNNNNMHLISGNFIVRGREDGGLVLVGTEVSVD